VAEYIHKELEIRPDRILKSQYPAASLFKIVTAAAAVENKGLLPFAQIPAIGRSTTLYKTQLNNKTKRYTISLKKAFATSFNSVFGKLAIDYSGPAKIKNMAQRLGFNRDRHYLDWHHPSYVFVPDSGFELAEVGAGFNLNTTISPVHASLMTRAIGHDGRLKMPRWIKSIKRKKDGLLIPIPYPKEKGPFLDPRSLTTMRELLNAPITAGTASPHFVRVLPKRKRKGYAVGGKTGSLTGKNPPGKYDWFAGYIREKKFQGGGFAIACMTIQERIKRIYSAQLAALLMKDWVKHKKRSSKKKGPRT